MRRRQTTFWTVALVGCLAALAPAPSAWTRAAAQTLAVPDRAALDAKVEALKRALLEKRYGALVTGIPPKLLDRMAAKVAMPRDQFLHLVDAQVTKVMSSGTVDAFEVLPGEIQTLPNGAVYALLPTVTQMTIGGTTDTRKARSKGHIVAIVDSGTWYLARISEQQWPLFFEAYPAYADLQVPKEKLEFVK